jgi:hypothetical protein
MDVKARDDADRKHGKASERATAGLEVKPKLFKYYGHRAVVREFNLHVGTKDAGRHGLIE